MCPCCIYLRESGDSCISNLKTCCFDFDLSFQSSALLYHVWYIHITSCTPSGPVIRLCLHAWRYCNKVSYNNTMPTPSALRARQDLVVSVKVGFRHLICVKCLQSGPSTFRIDWRGCITEGFYDSLLRPGWNDSEFAAPTHKSVDLWNVPLIPIFCMRIQIGTDRFTKPTYRYLANFAHVRVYGVKDAAYSSARRCW